MGGETTARHRTAGTAEPRTLTSGLHLKAPPGWIGVTLKGTYEIVRKIASGGMGSVYEATHVRLGQRVAVKVLRPECLDKPELLARFAHEAEIVANLRHPHIVTVLDVDKTEDGHPFLVMEYLEGETLGERLLRQTVLPIAKIGRIALQIASALACTHAQGVVHRDLKPENVMLLSAAGETDFVKVLDFGISKAAAGARLTSSRVLLGTPAYMAPEQVERPNAIDHRADQFALATIMYEALTGVPPHDGATTNEIVMSLTTRDPRPLREIVPEVPIELANVVMRALATDPDARFRDISQFAWALERALESASTETPIPRSPRAERAFSKTERATNPHAVKARDLLGWAKQAFLRKRLDDAVGYAEELIELAAYRGDPEVYAVIGHGIAALDAMFEARVGPHYSRLERTDVPSGDSTLSAKAKTLLSFCEGRTIDDVLRYSGIPRRDAMRMLAGLMRRRLLIST